MNIGIIGLGLIGGSLGLALRDMKLIDKVSGYDKSEQNAKDALELGLVDELKSFEEIKNSCDVIFIAVPVEGIIKVLARLEGAPLSTTIIDLGSTKERIVKSCPTSLKSQFIAAHPMAGTEYSGPKAAFKELLKGAAVSHDHHVGFISHLPHAISFSLVNATLSEEERRNIFLLGGSSFAGMARIAKSSEIMWTDIFRQNKDNILGAMQAFKAEFAHCEDMLKNERWDELSEWMKNAHQIKEIL